VYDILYGILQIGHQTLHAITVSTFKYRQSDKNLAQPTFRLHFISKTWKTEQAKKFLWIAW
jgi:hypothetical protein